MGGREDVPAPFGNNVKPVPCLGATLLRGTVRKRLLRTYQSRECKPSFAYRPDFPRIHPRRLRLHCIEYIQSHLDKGRHDIMRITAGVHHGSCVVVMREVDEFPDSGAKDFIEVGR